MQNKSMRQKVARQPIDLFPQKVIWELELQAILLKKGNLDQIFALNTIYLN